MSERGRIDELTLASEDSNHGPRRYFAGIVAVIAFFFFILIAADVKSDGALTLFDARINLWLYAHRLPALTTFFLFVSKLHTNLSISIATLVVCAYLWSKRLRYGALTMLIAVSTGILLNVVLKLIFARARPHFENPILTLRTFSFPSGHTTAATLFYGSLCVLVMSRISDSRLRVGAILTALLMIGLVGFSRMYLGAHYLSDVMAGINEGVAWVALSFLLIGLIEHGDWERGRPRPQ